MFVKITVMDEEGEHIYVREAHLVRGGETPQELVKRFIQTLKRIDKRFWGIDETIFHSRHFRVSYGSEAKPLVVRVFARDENLKATIEELEG